MNLKKRLKKGGVADIVTIMIIVGIVIALIIAVVIPMVNNSKERGQTNLEGQQGINDEIDSLSEPIS